MSYFILSEQNKYKKFNFSAKIRHFCQSSPLFSKFTVLFEVLNEKTCEIFEKISILYLQLIAVCINFVVQIN